MGNNEQKRFTLHVELNSGTKRTYVYGPKARENYRRYLDSLYRVVTGQRSPNVDEIHEWLSSRMFEALRDTVTEIIEHPELEPTDLAKKQYDEVVLVWNNSPYYSGLMNTGRSENTWWRERDHMLFVRGSVSESVRMRNMSGAVSRSWRNLYIFYAKEVRLWYTKHLNKKQRELLTDALLMEKI